MEPRDDGAEIGPLPRADDAGAAGASVGARPRFAWGFARGREMSALLALLLGGAAAPAPAMIVIDEAATVREEAPPHGAIGLSTAWRISDAVPAPRSRTEERREGKSVAVRVDLGGRRILKKKTP